VGKSISVRLDAATAAEPARLTRDSDVADVNLRAPTSNMSQDAVGREAKASGSRRAFYRTRARLAAFALHHKHPQIAREAGRKGGEATSQRYALGKRAWGVAMAMRRWHGASFHYIGSRAPEAGSGSKGDGIPCPGPATARSVHGPPRAKDPSRAQQLRLL